MSTPELVTLTVDGKTVQVPKGTLLIEAAKQVHVDIPVFCYHPKLDPAGVCRMCLVQIEKMPKPVTACTTTVSEGMVVHTQSELAQTVQQGVLEFLLLNHPLDCPVCDKGGECMLQDHTLTHGKGTSRLEDPKIRKNKAAVLGPFIILDEERCILCRRCTRFDDEIAAEGNLIIGERGHYNVVTTLAGRPYDSYFSGNTIELCPVGALTADLYRFKARPWDLSKTPGVCTGCSVGCNIELEYRHGELVRVEARENPQTDGGWLCDRGRFNYLYANDPAKPAQSGRAGVDQAAPVRLSQPLVRRGGELVPATWGEAMAVVGEKLRAIRDQEGGRAIGVIGGGRLMFEEAYLLQKLARTVLGTNNIDYRVAGQAVAGMAQFPGRQTDVNDADVILVVDVLPGERVPVLDLRVRRAIERRGAQLVAFGPAMPVYRQPIRAVPVQPGDTRRVLSALAAELAIAAGSKKVARPELPSGVTAATIAELAGVLAASKKVVAIWGGEDPEAGQALLQVLSHLEVPKAGRRAHLLVPGEQAGSMGAAAAGCLPGYLPGLRPAEVTGLNTPGMLKAAADGQLKALYLAGANLALTWPDGPAARAAFTAVDFLIVQDLFLTETARLADVVLPAAPFPAKTGHLVALDGLVQIHRHRPAMAAGGQAMPDGAIFNAVAIALGAQLKHTDPEVARELEAATGIKLAAGTVVPGAPVAVLERATATWPLVRGIKAALPTLALVPVERLFAGGGTAAYDAGIAHVQPEAAALLHPADLAELDLADGDAVRLAAAVDLAASVDLVARADGGVRRGTVQVPRGLPGAAVNRLGLAPSVIITRREAGVRV